MKADKIYVGIQDLGSGYATDVSLTPKEGHSEYIRKDALLEWAKEAYDSGPIKDSADKGDAWSIGYLCGMKDIIDRLNTL